MTKTLLLAARSVLRRADGRCAGSDRQDRRFADRGQGGRKSRPMRSAIRDFRIPQVRLDASARGTDRRSIRHANGETEYYAESVPAAELTPAEPAEGTETRGGRGVCRQALRDRRAVRPERRAGASAAAFGRRAARAGRLAGPDPPPLERIPQARPADGGDDEPFRRPGEHEDRRRVHRGERSVVGRFPGLQVVPREGRGVVSAPPSTNCSTSDTTTTAARGR